MKEDGMDIEPSEGRELVHRVAKEWVREAELIPLVLIALEVDEPVELVADRLGEAVQLDDIGIRAVPAEVVRQFLTERGEQAARMAEQSRRLQEAHKPSPVDRGVPALEGAGPFQSMMAADSTYASPHVEFGGRPAPRFLEEQLEAGTRKQAAARAETEAKKAARDR